MLLGSMLSWADTVLVRVLSGLGLLLLTAAQPKALTWHHAERGESDAASGKHLAGEDGAASNPLTPPAEKKQREPLTLASTLPQTMSPRSPVGTVSEAERQAGDGKPRTQFADGPDAGAVALAIVGTAFAAPAPSVDSPVAAGTPPLTNLARRLLCVISPAGPPRA